MEELLWAIKQVLYPLLDLKSQCSHEGETISSSRMLLLYFYCSPGVTCWLQPGSVRGFPRISVEGDLCPCCSKCHHAVISTLRLWLSSYR